MKRTKMPMSGMPQSRLMRTPSSKRTVTGCSSPESEKGG